MSKAHRGRPLKREGINRGTCPITGLSGVKLLYEHESENGEKIKISKAGHAKFKNIKKVEARKTKAEIRAKVAAEKPKETPAPVESPVEAEAPKEAPAPVEESAEAEVPKSEMASESASVQAEE